MHKADTHLLSDSVFQCTKPIHSYRPMLHHISYDMGYIVYDKDNHVVHIVMYIAVQILHIQIKRIRTWSLPLDLQFVQVNVSLNLLMSSYATICFHH